MIKFGYFFMFMFITTVIFTKQNQARGIYFNHKYGLNMVRTKGPTKTLTSSNNKVNRNNYYFKMMKQNKDEQLKKLIKLHNLANEMTNNKLVQPFKWNVSIKSK